MSGATFLSAFQTSHNADSAVFVTTQHFLNSTEFAVNLVTAAGQQAVLHVLSVPTGPTGGTAVCGWETLFDGAYTCMHTVSTSGNTSAFHRVAYSPMGDRAWLAINHMRRSFTGQTEMVPCQGTRFNENGLPLNLCREFTFEERSQGVDVYAIGISDGSRTPLWKDPSGTVFWIGISEGGLEEVAALGVIRNTSRVTYLPAPLDSSFYIAQTRGSQTISDCRYEFRLVASGQVERIPSANVCSTQTGTGTLAAPPPPVVSGGQPSLRVPVQPRRARH